jgi:hypothetical protein
MNNKINLGHLLPPEEYDDGEGVSPWDLITTDDVNDFIDRYINEDTEEASDKH